MCKIPSSISEQAALVGRTGLLRGGDGILTRVKVVDVKRAYGNVRLEVVPLDGEGSATVDAGRVTLDAQ